jgi:hypothetical protein
MKIGDVSRARRFANPARLRWYAFHRSVRFALRMLKTGEAASQSGVQPLHFVGLPAHPIQDQRLVFDLVMETQETKLENEQLISWACRNSPGCLP